MCFQLRIVDVTEVFVLKYCPLCLNITSKSETEMFSMNNQRQMFTCESRTVTQRVTKGHQIAVHLQPERRRLLTIQQRNQIIHRTIVDFASMSYLNFSRSHKDIREIKLDVTWSYVKRQTAKMTSEFVFFSSNPSLNHIKIETRVLLFATNKNICTLVFKEPKVDGKSFIFAVCRLT